MATVDFSFIFSFIYFFYFFLLFLLFLNLGARLLSRASPKYSMQQFPVEENRVQLTSGGVRVRKTVPVDEQVVVKTIDRRPNLRCTENGRHEDVVRVQAVFRRRRRPHVSLHL
jgi:hypothetical protein